MSKISNQLPKEGDNLSSTDLNSLFSAWVGATNAAMNEDNAANQSIDITNLDLQASTGAAGFILKTMQGHNIANAGITLASETATGVPGFNTITNSEFSFGASGKTLATNDILRIYYNVRVGAAAYATPFGAAANEWRGCWLTWLEYASSWSGAPANWQRVPGQANPASLITSNGGNDYYGVSLSNTRSMTVIPHQMGELASTGSPGIINTTQQDFNGQYYHQHTGANDTWYGLRIRIGGIFWPFNYNGNNYLVYSGGASPIVSAGNTITYYNGNILWLQMMSS
tara:strand:- start:1438 stop:2289 length:852 start_codon:yes stop_codon:yes gene_type:complete